MTSILNGLILWSKAVLPALLPFFFLSKMLTELGSVKYLSLYFEKITKKFFKVDGIGSYAFIMSIFSGYPGAFVGLGNCLVTTREHGKADVTFVDDDSSLSLPIAMTYADLPTVEETVMDFNENKVRVVGEDE